MRFPPRTPAGTSGVLGRPGAQVTSVRPDGLEPASSPGKRIDSALLLNDRGRSGSK